MNKRTPPDTGHEEPTSADGRGVPPGSVERVLSIQQSSIQRAIHLFIQKRAVTTVIQAIHLTLMSPARLHTYTAYTVGFLAV